MRLPPTLLALLTLLSLGATSLGCKASVKADLNASGDETSSRAAGFEEPRGVVAAPPPSKQTAFIGVTHALSLSPDAVKTPACSCIAATVGDPSNAAFRWRGTAPEVGEDATVLALTSTNVPCDREARAEGVPRGASIRGVARSGADVVVTLEEAHTGIPVAEGAVIPRPLPGGDVILRPAHRSIPYARPGADGALCRIPVR